MNNATDSNVTKSVRKDLGTIGGIQKDVRKLADSLKSLPEPSPFVPPTQEANESVVSYAIRVGQAASAYHKESGNPLIPVRKAIVDGLAAIFADHGMGKSVKGVSGTRPRYTEEHKRKAYAAFLTGKPISEIEMSTGIQASTLNNWKRACNFVNGGKGLPGGVEEFVGTATEESEDDSAE